jgi:hypothetical protein
VKNSVERTCMIGRRYMEKNYGRLRKLTTRVMPVGAIWQSRDVTTAGRCRTAGHGRRSPRTGSGARRRASETEPPAVSMEIRHHRRPRVPKRPPVQGGSGQASPRLQGPGGGQDGCKKASVAGPRRRARRLGAGSRAG